jgi:hypothetical protein
MRTGYVAKLQERNPTRLACYSIEEEGPNERIVYLGEDHPDHVTAVDTFRVTSDGEVWREATASNLELLWVPVR